MKNMNRLLIVPLALLTFGALACGGDDAKKVDDALNNDLSLASQARPYTQADSISMAERTNGYAPASAPAAPVAQRTVVHHVYESAPSANRSQPATHIEKHPGRDAAIGAGAGAVIGAVSSKNKVKGGLIGAAAGGILGAVIGNNVDKKKVPNH
jgi:hypothetical protein